MGGGHLLECGGMSFMKTLDFRSSEVDGDAIYEVKSHPERFLLRESKFCELNWSV